MNPNELQGIRAPSDGHQGPPNHLMCCLVEKLLVRLDATDLGVVVRLSMFVKSVLQPGEKKTETLGNVS